MTIDGVTHGTLLRRVDVVEREIKSLKRDLLRSLVTRPQTSQVKPSLFSSVRGGDVTEEVIEEAKRALFPPVNDIANDD
jgi:hypothetical protein